MNDYYVNTAKGQRGPFTLEQLKHFVGKGTIQKTTAVSVGNTGKWVTAQSIQGLFSEIVTANNNTETKLFDLNIENCPKCNDRLVPSEEPPIVTQQIEIPPKIIHVTEYRQHACDCKNCNVSYYAPLPDAVAAGGLFGPNLTATVGYLKGRCHLSYTSIKDLCRDMLGFDVSRGHLTNARPLSDRA